LFIQLFALFDVHRKLEITSADLPDLFVAAGMQRPARPTFLAMLKTLAEDRARGKQMEPEVPSDVPPVISFDLCLKLLFWGKVFAMDQNASFAGFIRSVMSDDCLICLLLQVKGLKGHLHDPEAPKRIAV
jgi:hypothetical protein